MYLYKNKSESSVGSAGGYNSSGGGGKSGFVGADGSRYNSGSVSGGSSGAVVGWFSGGGAGSGESGEAGGYNGGGGSGRGYDLGDRGGVVGGESGVGTGDKNRYNSEGYNGGGTGGKSTRFGGSSSTAPIPRDFLNLLFPAKIACGSSGGPEYSTSVAQSAGGHEQRNVNWSRPRLRFSIAPTLKTAAELEELLAFFRLVQGRARSFRFRDWSDYRVEGQLIGRGDGVRRIFPLFKEYRYGGGGCGSAADVVERRRVRLPRVDSVAVQVLSAQSVVETDSGGVGIDTAASAAVAYTVDEQRGLVVFAVPPAAGSQIRAWFEFDVPVRFDSDHLPFVMEGAGLFEVGEIKLVEVRDAVE